MRKHLVLFCGLLPTPYLLGQAPGIAWQHALGGSATDEAKDVEQTADGGSVIIGSTQSTNGDVTGLHGGTDIWVVKLDALGALVWQRTLGGSGYDYPGAISPTSDGGYIAVGRSSSTDGDVTGNHGGTADAWVAKLDTAGNIQWQRSLGGTLSDWGYDVLPTNDGGYIVAASTYSSDGDVTFIHGYEDAWLIKLNALGDIVWERTYGGSLYESAKAVRQTIDGGFILAGYTQSTDGDVVGNNGWRDAWVVKVDGTGNIQWQACYGGTQMEDFGSLATTSDGGYILAGNAASEDGDVVGWHPGYTCGSPHEDGWIVKIDGSGSLEWQRCLGGLSFESMMDVQQTPDNRFVVAGVAGWLDGDVETNLGGNDYWVLQLDPSGNIDWQTSLGGSSSETPGALALLDDGGIEIVGSTGSTNGDVTGHHGGLDIWAVKLTGEYNTITGTLFCDMNSNGAQDMGEPPIPYRGVQTIGTGEVTWSRQDGTYHLVVAGDGNFDMETMAIPNYSSAPTTHSAAFTGFQQTDAANDFALQPTAAVNDLTVAITPSFAFRPGFSAQYSIHYSNVGTTGLAPTLVFQLDPNFIFDHASVAPDAVTADSIVWMPGTVQPFEGATITVYGTVDQNAPLGSTIASSASIAPLIDDVEPSNNSATWDVTVIGSYDPNDIIVDRATVEPAELVDPPYLNYAIRFQNTGTDTAFTVLVEDILPQELQFSTFQFVAASHPMEIAYNANSKRLSFRFDNILLPDSNTNEEASHGYVHYRIKPLSSLTLGDSILNQAAIFFDYNSPVFTNTAHTVIEAATAMAGAMPTDDLLLYPNPARGSVRVNSITADPHAMIVVADVTGRELLRDRMTGTTQTLNVIDLPRGVYMVSLHTTNGERTQRLVLE
ncbi:MAG: T9SS type A sorting domain-containing protein [Flavobacteriales bacterium]|nr:T9SS type A sorting domain-containing protein [Flavobacteriales bacterium]MBP6696004.1 T9SS type A sorting domain-containing protein [Flavobacteriales bacterium]